MGIIRHATTTSELGTARVGATQWDEAHDFTLDAADLTFTQSGAGATARTVDARLKDMVSVKDFGAVGDGVTSDQTAIANAVAYAYANGVPLYWPDGTYLSTASIANLHSVRHAGPGAILRGTDTFTLDPKAQSNKLYLSASGDNANDGLTASQPLATVQKAFDALVNYCNPILQGSWTIQLAAGTYTGYAIFDENLNSINRVVIKGPDVSRGTPTAIIDGTGSAYAHGLYFSNGAFIELRDLLVQNFTTSGGYGILFNRQQWDVNLINVWSQNNDSGAAFIGTGVVQWQYGKIASNVVNGIVVQDRCRYTLGYGASTVYSGTGAFLSTDGLYIVNNGNRGVDASRVSYGYIQYCLIENQPAGVYVHLLTRARLLAPLLKDNVVGFVCRDNSVVNNSATFSGNTVDQQFFSGGVSANYALANVQNLGSVVHLGSSVADSTQPASSSGVYALHVSTFATLPGNSLRSSRGKLRVTAYGTITNTANYVMRVYVGGNFVGAATITDAITAGAFKLEMEISASTSSATQVGFMRIETPTKSYSAAISATRDLSADSAITIYTQRNNGTDAATFNYASAELFGEML
jgi:hypothetical protein